MFLLCWSSVTEYNNSEELIQMEGAGRDSPPPQHISCKTEEPQPTREEEQEQEKGSRHWM
jgi:hypothetical protein